MASGPTTSIERERTPSQAEVDGWVNSFANGLTNENLVAGFIASQEYFSSLAKGKNDKKKSKEQLERELKRKGPAAPVQPMTFEVVKPKRKDKVDG